MFVNSENLHSLIIGSKLSYLTNVPFNASMEKNQIIPYYSINIDKTNTTSTLNYLEQSIESYGFSSSTIFDDRLLITNQFDKSIYLTKYLYDTSYTDPYYNYSHITNYNPFEWMNTSFNLSHEESISPIPGLEDRVEDRQNYNILKLSPDASLEDLKFPKWAINPFKGSTSTAGYIKTKKRENNFKKLYYEDRYFGTLNQLKPFEGFVIPSFKVDAYESSISDKKETSYQRSSASDTTYYSYLTGFTYQSNLDYLNKMSFDGSIEKSSSVLDSSLVLTSGITNLTVSSLQKDSQKYGVNIRLPDIPVFFTDVKRPTLRYEISWDIKTDKNDTKSTDSSLNSYLIDNQSVSKNAYELNFSIFNQVQSKSSALDERSFYNRNKQSNIEGSLYKRKQNIDSQARYPLFGFIKNTEYLKFERINQFSNDNINVFPNEIKSANDNTLKLDELLGKHETELKLFDALSLTGKAEVKEYDQTTISETETINSSFIQNKGHLES